jgi:hypothetical protein
MLGRDLGWTVAATGRIEVSGMLDIGETVGVQDMAAAIVVDAVSDVPDVDLGRVVAAAARSSTICTVLAEPQKVDVSLAPADPEAPSRSIGRGAS